MLVRPIKKRKFALSELVAEITKDVQDYSSWYHIVAKNNDFRMNTKK